MTSTIKVQSHNYPVKVEIYDREWDEKNNCLSPLYKLTDTLYLWPDHGQKEFHCTTSRMIQTTDVEMDDPDALATKPKTVPKTLDTGWGS